MGKFVVTISREYGSGGRLIGELAAEKLGVAFYNRNLIDLTARRSGLAEGYITQWEERKSSRFIWSNPVNMRGGAPAIKEHYYSNEDKMFITQSKIIKELAERESCVIVGRCADYILRETDRCINIFIRSKIEAKRKRLIEDYGVAADKAEAIAKNTDKGRANYYKHYTDVNWGDSKYYHLVVDSGLFGIEGTAELISTAVKRLSNTFC